MLLFMKIDILSMVDNTPFRIVINYWSKMTPIRTRVGNFPKADEIILGGKATMPQRKLETTGPGSSPFPSNPPI